MILYQYAIYMKILQIVFSIGFGGAERFVVDLSNELSKNHDVTLLTLKEDKSNPDDTFYKFDLSSRVHYDNLGLPQKFTPVGLWRVYQYVKQLMPDVVHMHLAGMPKFCYLANLILGNKITFVQTIHNDIHKGYKNLLYDVVNFTLGRTGKIRFAALSETNYKDLCKVYPKTLSTCITNGRAPIEKTTAFETVAKEIEGYKKYADAKVVIHIARCNTQKNQELLISGFNKLIEDGYHATLIILGGGFESTLGEKLKQMACNEVHFLGPKENVGDYLMNSDVFTLSSHFEGMPITLLEAMLCGVPMVSTPVCGAVDVIDGKNGVLAKDFTKEEYVKALVCVLQDIDSYKKYAQKAALNSPYTIQKCAAKYVEFYKY